MTDVSRYDGRILAYPLEQKQYVLLCLEDTAYRNEVKEKVLTENGFRSQLHRKKLKKKPMPLNTHRANGKKSKIRACVEHVFAVQKERMGLFIQTIGLDRARIKITFANLAYNLQRLVFWEKRRTITQ